MLFDISEKPELAKLLAVSPGEIDYVLSRLPYYYRPRPFPKAAGGFRTLLVPQGKLKLLQQKIKAHILDKFPLLPCVHGGVNRRSIISNAQPHVARAVVFSLDIKDFFPHVGPDRVGRIFAGLGFRDHAAQILTTATTYKFQLPQGAPTSTSLANLSLIRADFRILKLAEAHGLAYTRFVDDLTLSGEWRLLKFRRLIPRILESEGFRVKPEKTMTMDRGTRQIVTKLVVNGKINVSRERRESIRREILDHVGKGGEADPLPSLRGRVHWLGYVNPDVGKRLLERLQQIGRAGPTAA